MSQQPPFALLEDDVVIEESNWPFRLLGHFDKMRIKRIDELNEFAPEQDKLSVGTLAERLAYSPETQRLFLHARITPELESIINGYANESLESQYNFLALVAIKFRRPFPMAPYSVDCSCIERFVNSYKTKEPYSPSKPWRVNHCVLKSLSLDDVYLLLEADDPNTILECVYEIQSLSCNCMSNYKGLFDNSGESKWHQYLEYLCRLLQNQLDNDEYKQQRETAKTHYVKFYDLVVACGMHIRKVIDGSGQYIDITTCLESMEKLLMVGLFKNTQDSDNPFNPGSSNAFHDYFVREWLINCCEIIRLCGDMPFVLKTNTIVGYSRSKSTFNNFVSDFTIRVSKLPGATTLPSQHVNRFNEAYSNFKPKESLPPFNLAHGQYEHQWNGCISQDILNRYAETFMSYQHLPVMKIDGDGNDVLSVETKRHVASNFSIKLANQNEDKAELSRRKRYLAERIHLANLWLRAQHTVASLQFSRIRECANSFPLLEPYINAIDKLHIYGCQSMYYANSWHEFTGTGRFFRRFCEGLRASFEELRRLESAPYGIPQYYALMIRDAIDISLDKLSSLFGDRMVQDMAIQENTRPTTYATGAFEHLIKRYTEWVSDIRNILVDIADDVPESRGKDKISFLLLPVERDVIHTDSLFAIADVSRRIVFFELAFNQMLDIPYSVAILVHEVGHYLGRVQQSERVQVYMRMCAKRFVANIIGCVVDSIDIW